MSTTPLTALTAACESGRFDRSRVVNALDAPARDEGLSDEAAAAVLGFGTAMLSGRFGHRPSPDVLERCVRLLALSPDRRALPLYRACIRLEVLTPTGVDLAAALRGLALAALHPMEPREARCEAARLFLGTQSASGEPARTALAILGAAGDDVAILLACHTALRDDIPLRIAALQELSADVPAVAFWEVAGGLVGDRFADAVLAIVDLITEGRREDLLPGFTELVPLLSDPDLLRAVLLSLLGARLDGVDAVFSAAVAGCPLRAMPGIEEALMLARIPSQDALLARLSERTRRGV